MSIGVSTSPSKTPPPLSCQAPLISANYPSPLFRQSPLYTDFSWPALPSSKFLIKTSQFPFLVVKKQIILVYKLIFGKYLISDFNLIAIPLKKSPPTPHPPLSQHAALKTEVLSSLSPPLWKCGRRFNLSPSPLPYFYKKKFIGPYKV